MGQGARGEVQGELVKGWGRGRGAGQGIGTGRSAGTQRENLDRGKIQRQTNASDFIYSKVNSARRPLSCEPAGLAFPLPPAQGTCPRSPFPFLAGSTRRGRIDGASRELGSRCAAGIVPDNASELPWIWAELPLLAQLPLGKPLSLHGEFEV